jgi:sugar/nucleoside kinase (ribokinase family)
MAVDVLILNTGVVDFRKEDFDFADQLVGEGGLTKCDEKDRPGFSQDQLAAWIKQGFATLGGPGNTAPLMARAGLKTAVGVNLGGGSYGGMDAQGRFFCDTMIAYGVDMSATHLHPHLPTGTTYIHRKASRERGGIAYFPGASDDFDFEIFKSEVQRLQPGVVYYMYVGLSDRGDANDGRDLALFLRWCRNRGIVTVADTTTLAQSPQVVISTARPVPAYRLLEPVLPEVDVFFTSSDEARMIVNTLATPRDWRQFDEQDNSLHFLDFLSRRFWPDSGRTRLAGVTVSTGAYEKHMHPTGTVSTGAKIQSRFLAGEVVDLVGAGDAFRAGLITYLCRNLTQFVSGSIDFAEAVQMGNLFAALYIKAPLNDRYGIIRSYDKMLKVVRSKVTYPSFEELADSLRRTP